MAMMNRGMSLIELMIALSIMGISLSLAIPTFSELIQDYRFKSAALTLEKDLRFAKYTANQKKIRVSICISNNQTHCIQTPSHQWQQGWIVFLDPYNNFQPLPHNILRTRESLHPNITITSNINIQHGIQFNIGKKAGKSLGSGLANGHFILCNHNKNAHKLILNIYGRLHKEPSIKGCAY